MEKIDKYVLSTSGLIKSNLGDIMLVEDHERIVKELEQEIVNQALEIDDLTNFPPSQGG